MKYATWIEILDWDLGEGEASKLRVERQMKEESFMGQEKHLYRHKGMWEHWIVYNGKLLNVASV